jgi:hypothetical protein
MGVALEAPDGAGGLVGSVAMCRLVIAIDDPRVDDMQELVARHLAFANECTPPEDVHALDLDGLLNTAVTVFSARRGQELLAIGALQHLDESHAELMIGGAVALRRFRWEPARN